MQNVIKSHDFYDIGYVLIMFNCFISENTAFGDLLIIFKNISIVLALACFLIVATQFRYGGVKNVALYIVVIILGVTNYRLLGSAWILYSILLILYGRNRDIKHFIQITYNGMLTVFIVNILLFIFQYYFSPNSLTVVTSGDKARYAMSFLSPNEAMRFWLYIVFLWYYLTENIKVRQWVFITCVSYLMFNFTASDTVLYIAILLLMHLMKENSLLNRFVCISSKYSFIILGALTLILVVSNTPWLDWLDENLFTGRLRQVQAALVVYGYTWLGNPIDTSEIIAHDETSFKLLLDNGYGFMVVKTGTVFAILISVLFMFTSTKNNYKLSCSLILYALMTLAENNMLHPTAVFPLVAAFNSIFHSFGSSDIVSPSIIRKR